MARLRRGGHRPSTVRSAAAHRKNKIGAPARQESVKTEQIETHLPDFGGTLSQIRTDRFIPESRIEKNEDEVFATTQTAAAAHFAAVSGVVP